MTSRTGPWGIWTRGRVAPLCATTGPDIHPLDSYWATSNIDPIFCVPLQACIFLQASPGRGPAALPDTLSLDTVQMQDAEQHVRRSLRVVREHHVTVSLERAVDAADENHRHLLVRVPMRIAHVAALVDQHVIEHRAVAVGHVLQLLDEVRQVLHVIAVDLGVVRDVLRLVAVVRRPCQPPVKPDSGKLAPLTDRGRA